MGHMKLFDKYSRVNIIASILALLVGSVAYYFIIRSVLIRQLDSTLRVEEAEILDFVKTRDRMPEPANYRDQQISFIAVAAPVRRRFIDTSWMENGRRGPREKVVRQLVFPVIAGGQTYTVTVAKSEMETEDLMGGISAVTGGMILLLLGGIFFSNRWLLRRLWQPFYTTLEAMRQFNLSSKKPLPVADTRIDEFRNLEIAAVQMTQKIMKDYEMLKNFADNASHEMQTPLAIINAKLDLMIQDQGLEERHLRQLQAMYDAVGRLSKLNQSLLLLTKIENNQFAHTDEVDLGSLIEHKLAQLEDLIRGRNLTVKSRLEPVTIRMNAYLADILLNNLLVNAIRHNEDGGMLAVRLQPEEMQISNTGPAVDFDEETIFDRFTKGGHSGGTGLGLAIVKQIGDNYGFGLSYRRDDQMHVISVRIPLQNFTKISG
jgi:signal transduction histidine kinase